MSDNQISSPLSCPEIEATRTGSQDIEINVDGPQQPRNLVSEDAHFLWQLVDAIPSPIFWKDALGCYGGCNKAFEAYIGLGRDQLIGKTVFDVAPPDLAPIYAEADQKLLDRRGTQIYEAEVEYANGSRHNVMFHKATFSRQNHELGGLVGVMLDVTERRSAEEALRLSAIVFERSAEGIMLTDQRGRILRTNRAFQEITGYSEHEVLGKTPSETLSSGSHDPAFYARMWDALAKQGHWSGEIINRRKSGELFSEFLSITRVDDANGNPVNFIGIFSDITEAKNAKRKIEELSYFDALTSLPNRVLLAERLDSAIGKLTDLQEGIAILAIGINGLDYVNDTFGHHMGDKLLVAISERLGKMLPLNAQAYRHAGDGFAVIQERVDHFEKAHSLAQHLLDALRQPFVLGQQSVSINPLIGISRYPQDGQDSAILLKNADVALHSAKSQALDGYEFFRPEMNQAVMERMLIETGMRQALQRNEFFLHYQPQVDLRNGRITGMEALARWSHPEMGMVSPAKFIPVAEASGLIIEMGNWVLREACRAARSMLGYVGTEFKVAVNVSARQFNHERFVDQVQAALAEAGLPAHCLELELTESLIMQRPEDAVRIMARLKSFGVTFSVDDFGSGYSSLSQLTRFPIDKLKIDRSFIQDITNSNDESVITRAVIALGHSLRLDVIAEGVETEAQKAFVMANGCNFIQGYLFSRPLPEQAMGNLLRNTCAPTRRDELMDYSI